MKCEQIAKVIYAYMDSELEKGFVTQIEAHLIECRPCVARAEFEKYLIVHVKKTCSQEALPDSLQSRILSMLDDE